MKTYLEKSVKMSKIKKKQFKNYCKFCQRMSDCPKPDGKDCNQYRRNYWKEKGEYILRGLIKI